MFKKKTLICVHAIVILNFKICMFTNVVYNRLHSRLLTEYTESAVSCGLCMCCCFGAEHMHKPHHKLPFLWLRYCFGVVHMASFQLHKDSQLLKLHQVRLEQFAS